MKFHKKLILVLQMMLLLGGSSVLTGCSGEGRISLEEALILNENETGAGKETVSAGGKSDAGENVAVTDAGNSASDSESGVQAAENLLYVYVCGSVAEPGVYALEEGSRIVAAIEAAGGFLEDAAMEAVNLAAPLSDGMQIVVPDLEEATEVQAQEEKKQDGRINLNRATAKELCTLQGIGEAKAEAILAYREEIGAFNSIEQIKNVAGIGENLFEQIKESIYIE